MLNSRQRLEDAKRVVLCFSACFLCWKVAIYLNLLIIVAYADEEKSLRRGSARCLLPIFGLEGFDDLFQRASCGSRMDEASDDITDHPIEKAVPFEFKAQSAFSRDDIKPI
jgi:hypothetical protein